MLIENLTEANIVKIQKLIVGLKIDNPDIIADLLDQPYDRYQEKVLDHLGGLTHRMRTLECLIKGLNHNSSKTFLG